MPPASFLWVTAFSWPKNGGHCGPDGRWEDKSYPIFDHLDADHQAFATDVSNLLDLLLQFRQTLQEVGAHLQGILLELLLFDDLKQYQCSRMAKTRVTHSYIKDGRSNSACHWVTAKGVEMRGIRQ